MSVVLIIRDFLLKLDLQFLKISEFSICDLLLLLIKYLSELKCNQTEVGKQK